MNISQEKTAREMKHLESLLGLAVAVTGLNITRPRGGSSKVFNVFQVTKFPNDEGTVSGTKVVHL